MNDPDEILDTYRSLRVRASYYAVAGIPMKPDEAVLIKRTAQSCRVDEERVRAVVREAMQ